MLLRLRPLHRALHKAIELRDLQARTLLQAGALGAVITRGHASTLLDQLGNPASFPSISTGHAHLLPDEEIVERELRERARAAGIRLPLDAMAESLRLTDFECEVLVLCATVEVDSEYEQVFAYVHDDIKRRVVSVELASALTAESLDERTVRRFALGAFGRLRRLGLVHHAPRETGLRDELRVTALCREALLGSAVDLLHAFRDPAEVALEVPAVVPSDTRLVDRVGDSIAARRVDVVALWGRASLTGDVLAAIATAADMPVRRLIGDPAHAIAAATALGALLWIDLDAFGDAPPVDLVDMCRATCAPLVLTAANPWRPSSLLAGRRCVEVPIIAPDHVARQHLWRDELPDVDPQQIEDAATAFGFDATEVRAAGRLARSLAALHTNGHLVTAGETLRSACLAVARKHGERHTTLVVPRRRADDLVLPPDLHARVLDLVHNFRAMPRVMGEWGFARRVSGGGLKGLFAGEPGTGKTLAAEVIANELGLPMLRVDLARVVSKWIGETEKNLDLVFNEARDSHAVLFFDEAEALFGARGDVRHGSDRYANLEVSYLLQRFEDHGGIVILATNLRDKIDPAFMRRFHVVVAFPRPGEKERRRLWQRVFASDTPMAGDLDITALARLDLTGAGIVGAAQSAALLAARENTSVAMRHVVHGLVRQYQREARVLNTHDLGQHAVYVDR
jgi:AAA+ superfamily predicted ATPase